MRAEITPGTRGSWHIAKCQPNREFTALRYLAEWRVGAYLPVEDIWGGKRGDELMRQKPLFLSYIFVFVWGLAENLAVIKTAPGVTGLLANTDGVPITVPDQIITDIEAVEHRIWLERLLAARPRAFGRKRRHEHWIVPPWEAHNYGFRHPDPDARIAALHKALGL